MVQNFSFQYDLQRPGEISTKFLVKRRENSEKILGRERRERGREGRRYGRYDRRRETDVHAQRRSGSLIDLYQDICLATFFVAALP